MLAIAEQVVVLFVKKLLHIHSKVLATVISTIKMPSFGLLTMLAN